MAIPAKAPAAQIKPKPPSTPMEQIIAQTMKVEGGLANFSNEFGGVTNYGISQRAHPNLDVKNLRPEQAAEIYRKEYWEPIKGDQLPEGIAQMLFDWGVQSGPATAIKGLQRALGLPRTGKMDYDTLAEVYRIEPSVGEAKFVQLLSFARKQAVNAFLDRHSKGEHLRKGIEKRINAITQNAIARTEGDADFMLPTPKGHPRTNPEFVNWQDQTPAPKQVASESTQNVHRAADGITWQRPGPQSSNAQDWRQGWGNSFSKGYQPPEELIQADWRKGWGNSIPGLLPPKEGQKAPTDYASYSLLPKKKI